MSSWRDQVAQIEIEKRRWAVIAHLDASEPLRELSAQLLLGGCRAQGIPTTDEQLEAALIWLSDQHYIKIKYYGAMTVAGLTRSGRDVVRGIRTVPGLIPFTVDL